MREMNDSGIEWIGLAPISWDYIAIKYLVKSRLGGSWGNDVVADNDEYNRVCMRIADFDFIKLKFKENENYTIRRYSKQDIEAKTLCYGYLLIEKYGGGEKTPVGRVVVYRLSDKNLYANFMERIRLNEKLCTFEFAKYFFYSLYSQGFTRFYYNQTTGIQNLNIERYFREIKVPLLPLNIQQQIADYLDTKCSEIDATAEDIQKEISLLEDYKKSVITEAVTKGLNPYAEMKDSGIKWLPKIPMHWKVIPSKYLFANSDIRRQTGDEQLTASQKYGIITQKDYTAKENAQIVLATQGLEKWKHVEPNDFIISLRSFQGGLEMSEITGCITWHYVVLKAQKEVCHKYYKWLFKSARYINALQGTCNFIRDGQDLRFSNFALVPLFELPLAEQQQIADFLDSKCSEIDSLIADKKRQLDILADYKKSLIYEYVTGKKEVPVNE